jgi:diguanylate cyclase
MRYSESREESAEMLRMVLPHMSRHAASFHPLSYAVWYEYCGGYNLGLRGAIDELIKQGAKLGDTEVETLYDKYVAMRELSSTLNARVKIKDIIDRVSETTSQVSKEVGQYTRGLTEYHAQLQEVPGQEEIRSLVDSMLEETERVRGRTNDLRTDLSSTNQEVERLKEELQIAQGLAQTDPLTALLNRRGLDQRVSSIPEAEMDRTAALFIDIDHFKTVNDTHGHLLGDRVIAVVATIIKTCVGDRGFSARMGGEEFAVIMTGINPASAAEMSERIRATVEKGRIRRQDSEEVIGTITVSVGAATHIPNEKIPDMMRRADRALYKSKQDGRNRITISTRSDN